MLIRRIGWAGTLLAAATIFVLVQSGWLRRSLYVTSLADGPLLAERSSSPSERAPITSRLGHGLIISEHNESSFHWLVQSHQMAERRKFILGVADYDNAPLGRPIRSPSLYRWWINAVASAASIFYPHPDSLRFDVAALYADSFLAIVGIGVLVAFAYLGFGRGAAAVVAIGSVSLFPLGAIFLPAAPDSRGMTALLVVGSLLFLLIGLHARTRENPKGSVDAVSRVGRGWFIAAGIASGLLAWVSLATAIPLVVAIIAGVFALRVLARVSRSFDGGTPALWRLWGMAGAVTATLSYLVDYLPRGGGLLQLDQVHPLYALAWISAVELFLAWPIVFFRRESRGSTRTTTESSPSASVFSTAKGPDSSSVESARGAAVGRTWPILRLILAATPLVALCWFRFKGIGVWPEKDLSWARLANLPGGAIAPDFGTWIKQEGLSIQILATLAPALVLPVLIWSLVKRGSTPFERSAALILLSVGLMTVWMGFRQLGWCATADGVFLTTAAILVANPTRASTRERGSRLSLVRRLLVVAIVCTASGLGLSQLRLREVPGPNLTLTAAETTQLVERDLAHWLRDRFGPKDVTVFAPPRETTAFCYFGAFKGIGTFAPENRAGFGTALSIVGAATMEEVEALIRARDVRCIVLPTWDPFLDDFARLYLSKNYSNRSSLLVRELRNWNLPPWLKPMAYQMPAIPGFEKHRVLVFEVVEPQTPALAASRLAECLVELGDLLHAKQTIEKLRRFPGDVGALAARVNVALALQDTAMLDETAGILKTRVQTRADRYLGWDRRVSLAVALAQIDALDLAKEQVARCVNEADEEKLRLLSPAALYRLLVLTKTFELPLADVGLRELSLQLLPAEARAQL